MPSTILSDLYPFSWTLASLRAGFEKNTITIRMAAEPVVAPSPVWIVIVLRGPISAAFAGWLVG